MGAVQAYSSSYHWGGRALSESEEVGRPRLLLRRLQGTPRVVPSVRRRGGEEVLAFFGIRIWLCIVEWGTCTRGPDLGASEVLRRHDTASYDLAPLTCSTFTFAV